MFYRILRLEGKENMDTISIDVSSNADFILSPDGSFIKDRYNFAGTFTLAHVKNHLKSLTEEQRIDFIDSCMKDYCGLCGSSELPCYCHPSFDD